MPGQGLSNMLERGLEVALSPQVLCRRERLSDGRCPLVRRLHVGCGVQQALESALVGPILQSRFKRFSRLVEALGLEQVSGALGQAGDRLIALLLGYALPQPIEHRGALGIARSKIVEGLD